MNQLLSFWTFDIASLSLLIGLGLEYGFLAGWRLQPGAALYFSGLLLIGLIQSSPLHVLGMTYLLSAHMVRHMVLLLICAPLLVLGLPGKPILSATSLLTTISRFFRRNAWLGWLIGLITMWFWHIPIIYDATTAHATAYGNLADIPLCSLTGSSVHPLTNLLHIVQPISLVLAGVCFCWPIIGPVHNYRIHPFTGVLYLFTACVGCSLLGLLITFAPVGTYQTYTGADLYGFSSLIRTDWGFDRATDQQTAGLLMWIPGCLIYLTGALYLLIIGLFDQHEPIRTGTVHWLPDPETK